MSKQSKLFGNLIINTIWGWPDEKCYFTILCDDKFILRKLLLVSHQNAATWTLFYRTSEPLRFTSWKCGFQNRNHNSIEKIHIKYEIKHVTFRNGKRNLYSNFFRIKVNANCIGKARLLCYLSPFYCFAEGKWLFVVDSWCTYPNTHNERATNAITNTCAQLDR